MQADNLAYELFWWALAVAALMAVVPMFQWRQKTAIKVYVGLGLLFAIVGAFWPAIADTVPQLRGAISTVLQSRFLIVAAFGALLLVPWLDLAYRQGWLRRTKTTGAYALTASATTGAVPDVAWLHKMAIADDDQINQRFYFCNRDTAYRGQLEAIDPYIDVELWFINASVFLLTLDRIDGRMQYLGNDLQSKPEILPPSTVPPTPMVVKHGEMTKFTVRQWLTHETRQRMLAGEGDAKPYRSFFAITTGQVAMTFKYTNSVGQIKEVRKAL